MTHNKSLLAISFISLFLVLVLFQSCNLIHIYKAKHGTLIRNTYKCYSPNVLNDTLLPSNYYRKYPNKVAVFKDNTDKFLSKNDSVLSIGARDGAFEFMASFYVDSIKFYLEDIDTACMSKYKIENIYLPKYNQVKKDISYYNLYKKRNMIYRDETQDSLYIPKLDIPISCTYEFVSGTDTSINANSNIVNKIYINRTYHHFTRPDKMINECSRLLTSNGKLIIGEYVTLWDRQTWKHCFDGAYYMTKKHFVRYIESLGYELDTIYEGKNHWCEFVFTKK